MPRPPTLTEEDELRDLRERVARLEWRDQQVETSLHKGAESFSEIRRQIAVRPTPWARVSGIILAGVIAVMGWVWYAAKYPERDEFESVRAEVQTDRVEREIMKRDLQRLMDEYEKHARQLQELAAKINQNPPRRRGR